MTDTKNVRLAGIRGIIARKMQESLQGSAQLSFHMDCDVSSLITAREAYSKAGRRVSYEDLICKSLSQVLRRFPAFNAHLVENIIHYQDAQHIAFAIAAPDGLMAPAVFNVQEKDVDYIALARRDLIERASARALSVEEMTGGTFTISNLGMTGVKYFTPILNTPQVAILGLGAIWKQPELGTDGELISKPYMGLSLTVDHRALDGLACGEFLAALCAVIGSLPGPLE
ncbi:2-oxo acid dehydrogenase subunit E2 [Kordiimonas gwangyangensis]|uniref:2-oxo acid dehydrogenase subunit E2 n=1 Tax=Kordiimonas gwangyangensis TaxID=288022 RepID=UPI00035EB221|nr:2-oxo acid dehydrogenase subunit E2 [Kordiimonas gwangyangensis]